MARNFVFQIAINGLMYRDDGILSRDNWKAGGDIIEMPTHEKAPGGRNPDADNNPALSGLISIKKNIF